MKDKSLCQGCRNDYYNGTGAKECWQFKAAKVVTRWRLGWWTTPDTPRAFTEVRTLDCHHEPGRFAFQKELPTFAVSPRRLSGGAR